MIDLSSAEISKLIVHRVGNKLLEDGVTVSDEMIQLSGRDELANILVNYFLAPFKDPVFHHFTHATSLELNEVFTIAAALFESTRGFVKKSKDIAHILYEYSNHPKIKSGELYVAYFEGCKVKNETVDAIGIFKSENKDTFLQVQEEDAHFEMNHEQGINIKKLDKGCVIFNLEPGEGYFVSIVDNLGGSNEAQYWKNEFLKLRPVADNYYQTRNYMSLAKDFVTSRLDEEFEVTKADQIDYLNKSMDYFQKHEAVQYGLTFHHRLE